MENEKVKAFDPAELTDENLDEVAGGAWELFYGDEDGVIVAGGEKGKGFGVVVWTEEMVLEFIRRFPNLTPPEVGTPVK